MAVAAFADVWLSIWAKEFDWAWPVVYELLSIVERDELYREPRRVGPLAAGGRENHGDCTYATFAEYFDGGHVRRCAPPRWPAAGVGWAATSIERTAYQGDLKFCIDPKLNYI